MKSKELLSLFGQFLEIEMSITNRKDLSIEDANEIQIKFAYLKYLMEIQLEAFDEEIENSLNPEVNKKDFIKNISFDPRIRSCSIEDSITNNKTNAKPKPLTARDLQVWVLVHLFRTRGENFNQSENKKMILFIDSFIENYKESLTYADIVRHQSGFARIATNLRFATNALQKIGLVSEDMKLTYFGYKVFLYFWKQDKNILLQRLSKSLYSTKIDKTDIDSFIVKGIYDTLGLKEFYVQNKDLFSIEEYYINIIGKKFDSKIVEQIVENSNVYTESVKKFIENKLNQVFS